MRQLTFVSLFAGIGGFDLGLERAGMKCIAQVEIDPYCQRVLAKHWPDVPKFGDIRTVQGSQLGTPDIIAGGFPCQDISNAGKRAGITGERSGLWSEFFRLVCEVRPRYVIVENVAALLGRGIGTVLGDLAEIGFDAEWEIIPAAAIGAVHIRQRVFLVGVDSDAAGSGFSAFRNVWFRGAIQSSAYGRRSNRQTWWEAEPELGRVADGVPNRSLRHHALGNAVAPQVAELIGRAIVAAHADREAA